MSECRELKEGANGFLNLYPWDEALTQEVEGRKHLSELDGTRWFLSTLQDAVDSWELDSELKAEASHCHLLLLLQTSGFLSADHHLLSDL